MSRVAVLDLGSNSFKILVAEGARVNGVFEAFEDVRLLESRDADAVSAEKFAEGVAAAKRLVEAARAFAPAETLAVGTSVLRTATNAKAFCEAVRAATGVPVRVLSGEEEARGVARGVATDPLVKALPVAPAIFDLGGGSLEFIGSGGGTARSWKLGAARMTRECVPHPRERVSESALRAVRERVRLVAGTELDARTSAETPLVFCGGVLAVAHRLLARKSGVEPGQFPRRLPTLRLELLLERLARRTADERVSEEGVPAARADVMPAALAVVLEVADACGASELIWSPRNLRYGVAAEALDALRAA